MQQLIEFIIVLASVVFAWRKVAAWQARRGAGVLVAHLGGGLAGFLTFLLVMGAFVAIDPPPEQTQAVQQATQSGPPQPLPAKPEPAPVKAPVPAQQAKPVPDANAVKVSAGKLFDDYQENEVAADNAYKGRKLLVVATVQGVDKDVFGNVIVNLRTSNEFMPVLAAVEGEMEAKAGALKKGQKITLDCEGGGAVAKIPRLEDCVF